MEITHGLLDMLDDLNNRDKLNREIAVHAALVHATAKDIVKEWNDMMDKEDETTFDEDKSPQWIWSYSTHITMQPLHRTGARLIRNHASRLMLITMLHDV